MKQNLKYHYLHEWLGQAMTGDAVVKINHLSDHSAEIEVGDVFIDLSVTPEASKKHISQALQLGAAAVLTCYGYQNSSVPIIVIPSLKEKIASLTVDYYNSPSRNLQLVGITGTNGKTSTSLMMMLAANSMNLSCAYIGTMGYGVSMNHLCSTGLTTPSAVKLQRILHQMVLDNINMVAMEVSSHALVQKRTEGCIFDVGIFSNLTRDHLDYHQSMFDYAQAKKKFFLKHKVHHIVMNVDDPVGKQWEQELDHSMIPFTFNNVQTKTPAVQVRLEYCDRRGCEITLQSQWGKGRLCSPLMGKFNSYNLVSAWLGMVAMGYDLHEAAIALSHIQSVPGRFEVYGPNQFKPTVVIDYAHTPSALEEVLLAVRSLTVHNIWVVFGCGGDRDKGKRSLMGQVAERLADRILLTSDNPRNEDPELIIGDILKGMICPWAVEIEQDRQAAIYYAIREARAGDVILIAGKGHEDIQIVKNNRIPFSDKLHVLSALGYNNGE